MIITQNWEWKEGGENVVFNLKSISTFVFFLIFVFVFAGEDGVSFPLVLVSFLLLFLPTVLNLKKNVHHTYLGYFEISEAITNLGWKKYWTWSVGWFSCNSCFYAKFMHSELGTNTNSFRWNPLRLESFHIWKMLSIYYVDSFQFVKKQICSKILSFQNGIISLFSENFLF